MTVVKKADEAIDTTTSMTKRWKVGDSITNLAKKGNTPLVKYVNGKYYSMELHHIKPRHLGVDHSYSNLQKVTPCQHAQIDQYRHFK